MEKFEANEKCNSDMKWLIMNYLITEGHYAAAEKFFQEATPRGFPDPESILKGIQERDRIRSALHAGDAAGAIEMINDLDPEVCLADVSFRPPMT